MVNSFGELLELSLTTHLSPLKVELVKHAKLINIISAISAISST
jgi:hypothetical protein